MSEGYTEGIKEFLSLTIERLKRMRSASLGERQEQEVRWRNIIKHLYNEHYLLEGVPSMAYCPTYARIFYIEIQRNLKSNKPYTSQIIRDPNNAISPIANILDEINQTRIGSHSNIDLQKYGQYVEMLRKAVDKSIASNQDLFDIFQKTYGEVRLTGNSCVQREMINLTTNEFKCYHIPLNQISIYKKQRLNQPIYFFREIVMSFNEFKDFFPDKYSRNQCLSNYSELDKPENQFRKEIRIIENSYYCTESGKTVIRYYLDREEQKDLEAYPRIKNYQVFWYFQINAENSTYGRIDDKDHQVFMSLEEKQMLYRNLLEVRSKIEKSRTLDIVSLLQEKPLESKTTDSVDIANKIRRQNLERAKNISLTPQQVESFGGNLRNQNLEDPENIQRYASLEAMHFRAIEEFANNLNFDEAQKKVLIPLSERRDTTATEFKELLFASTLDKRQLEIMESFTSSFYIFMIEFYVGNFTQKIVEFRTKQGEKWAGKVGLDYDTLENETFFEVLSLDLNLTDDELKKNPFAYLSDDERVISTKQAYSELMQIYDTAETDEKRIKAGNAILKLKNAWENEIKDSFIPLLKEYKRQKHLIEDEEFANMIVMSADKDFLLFIINFKKYSRIIKFKLASPESNILDNQESQNFLKFVDISYSKVIPTNDPDIIRKTTLMLNLNENLAEIGSKLNLGTKLLTGKKLEEALEADRLQRLQEQIQISQGVSGEQDNN